MSANRRRRDRAVIAGIGWTPFTKNSGRTVLALAVEASINAARDAGLERADIDGIVIYGLGDTVPAQAVCTALGLPELRYFANLAGGGDVCVASVGHAAMAVESGMASNVLVIRALNGRSGRRIGGTGSAYPQRAEGEAQYTLPEGWVSFPQYNAMGAQRYLTRYGRTSEDLGSVAVLARSHAVHNERAIMRTPIDLADHQRSPVIAAPFRLLDCCLESDGACALVVTSGDRAGDLPAPAVQIATWAMGSGPRPGYGYDGFFTWAEPSELYAHYVGPQLWARAEVGPADVDVASIYDCFTFSVLTQLEGFGFCGPGEAADFVREGRADYGGDVVVNPHGGMLSEAYVHGLNGVVEIVQQLRGEAADRQVAGAEVALATGFGTTAGCGLVLTR